MTSEEIKEEMLAILGLAGGQVIKHGEIGRRVAVEVMARSGALPAPN